jgi:hypothetical protein
MRRVLVLLLVWAAALAVPQPALASIRDRVEELEQEVDSLTEEVEDLQEPVAEFDLFDQCMYAIGVTEYGAGGGSLGYLFGDESRPRRRALAIDIRDFGRPRYQFLAFPAEEPPSIECNEDAGQEEIDN